MARRRYNFQSGVLTSDIASGDLSFSSTTLAALPAVTGSDYCVVVIDPDSADPNHAGQAPELVYITAHTASATSATITRAQESTAAHAHSAGVKWELVATVLDFEDDLVDGTTLEVASGVHRIKAGGVGTSQIADSAVTSAKIADGGIATVDLADHAVTAAKLATQFVPYAQFSATTDSTGHATIVHGAGFNPTSVFVQARTASGGFFIGQIDVLSHDGTNINIRAFDTAGTGLNVQIVTGSFLCLP